MMPSKETFLESIKLTEQYISKQQDSHTTEIINGTKELAKYLKPYKISKSTLDKWVMNAKRKLNDLPFHKPGKNVYFYRSEIDEWLKSKSKF